MTRSERLDARRNIRKELVAFVSIVMIGLLAALAYLGIAYSAAALKQDALTFFNTRKLWDVEVTSTMLLTDEDLEAIGNIPGVGEVERVWQVDTRVPLGDKKTAVSVISVPEKISVPDLLEGRLPGGPTECAIEKNLAEDCGLTVGQHISITCDALMEVDPLAEHDFVVTGIFHTPDHFSYMVPVTPYIFVTEEAFNREGLDGAFMKLRLRVSGAPENRYGDEYWAAVDPVTAALEELSGERTAARTAGIRKTFEDRIHEGEREIESAREELRQAKQKIDSGRQDLETAEKQLGDMKLLIDSTEPLLIAGKEQLEEKRAQFNELERMLEDGDYVNISEKDWPDYIGIPFSEFQEKQNKLAPDEMKDWIRERINYDKLREALRYAEDVYDQARNSWYYTGEQYLDGITRYQRGKKQLEEGEQAYAEGEEKLRSAEQELEQAKEKLNAIGTCRWVLLNNNGNPGFIYAAANADKLGSLSLSFSSIFLVVGALVIYATISRMVEQQRKQIGVNKALGLYNREILGKYLIFACTAVLLGIGMGILLSWLPMQRAVLNSYEAHLNYGRGSWSFLPVETGVVILGAIAVSVLAVYLGCSQLLRQTALALMQGANPDTHKHKKKKARSSAKGSLYARLILRNMRTDWKRVLVTIVSIGGGCVLMVVGFTLRYGISGVPDRQFGGIVTYEAEVIFDTDANEDVISEVETILDENALQHVVLHRQDTVYEMNEALSALTLFVAEDGALDEYYTLRGADTGEPVSIPDSGALVPRRFSEYYHVSAGDRVTVYDNEMNRRELTIAGVFENYYGQIFFLTPRSYQEIFGIAPRSNCMFVRTGGMALSDLQRKLEGVAGVVSVNDAAAARTMIDQFTSGLNFVVYLMLFIAAMMCCFIVANFTLTFIQRKTNELTVMRINGFTAGECIRYVALDLVVTTTLGTLVGLGVGAVMGQRILRVTETPYIQMIREPRIESFLYAALFTFVFSMLANSYALRRIRRLKLTDIA